ncbi:MAG: hypothetical protein MJ117_07065, partial [Lachnospiraceae bacterium]|nr:hypothetical protein [Lachnospiraceae bacterium]
AAGYQWYYTKDGKKWYKSSSASAITDTITLKVSSSNCNNQYRCVVTGEDGNTVTSDIAAINLIPGAVITQQPVSVVSKIDQTIQYTVVADNAESYQWYYSKDGSSWYKSGSTGAATDTLSLKVSKTNMTYVYRCKVTGFDGNTKNSSIVGTVVITTQPVSCSAAVGEHGSFTVVAENAVTYKWQYSANNGSTWISSTAAGADTATTTPKVTTSNRTNLYRCKLTTANGISLYTDAVGYKEGMKIISQPQNAEAAKGDPFTFTVTATNVAENGYQWYYSKDGSKWYKSTNASATSNSITLTASADAATKYYRCKVTGVDGRSEYTDTVRLTLK